MKPWREPKFSMARLYSPSGVYPLVERQGRIIIDGKECAARGYCEVHKREHVRWAGRSISKPSIGADSALDDLLASPEWSGSTVTEEETPDLPSRGRPERARVFVVRHPSGAVARLRIHEPKITYLHGRKP